MKKVFKIILFISIFIILFSAITKIIIPSFDSDVNIKGIYNEKKNSIDVMFIGDSNIYNGISPMEIYNKYGITSYDYAAPAVSNMLTYYMLEEVLKYQSPKVVFMDVTSIFNGKDQEASTRKPIDNMRMGKAKLDFINDPIYNFSLYDKFTFYVPFFRYHKRFNELKKSDFTKIFKKYYSSSKGYIINYGIKPATDLNYMYDNNVDANFSTDYMPKYVLKAKQLCDDHNISLVLISIPDTNEWSYSKYENMQEWSKEKGITYIDFNAINNKIGIDFNKDTFDGGTHLNTTGAIKLSNYIAEYLHNNYKLEDHRNNLAYSNWNNDLNTYKNDKEVLSAKN